MSDKSSDSGRLLRACYDQLVAEAGASAAPRADDRIPLEAKVDAVCEVVTELRELLSAPATNGNAAKAKAKAGR